MENKRIIITTIDKIQEINVVEVLRIRENPNIYWGPNLRKNYGFNAGGNLVKTPCTPIHQWFPWIPNRAISLTPKFRG